MYKKITVRRDCFNSAYHDIGNEECNYCIPGFPKKCSCRKGLIHAELCTINICKKHRDYIICKCDKCLSSSENVYVPETQKK
jgi:hypothetical protein